MSDIALTVNGREYRGWTSASVTRGIEAIAGAFTLTVSERWDGQSAPWPIIEGDACVVSVAGIPVITGYVDGRRMAVIDGDHTFSVSGRDATGDLVDSSAQLAKSEYTNIGVLEFVRHVVAPFAIPVTLQDGLADTAISTTPTRPSTKPRAGGAPSSVGSAGATSTIKLGQPIAKLAINPGDSAFEVIEAACRLAMLLPVSDGAGGLVLTRAGGARATSVLTQAENILSIESRFDASARYARYIVIGQTAGNDDLSGTAAAAVRGEATDAGVRRPARVLLIRPGAAITPKFATARAAWEATVRYARSRALTVTVQGWTQRDGTLWPINALVTVTAPVLGVGFEEWLITEATYEVSPARGTLTTLTLAPPRAFEPEPTIPAPTTSSGSSVPSFFR